MPPGAGNDDMAVFGYVGRGASNAMRGRLADFTGLLGDALSLELTVFEASSYGDLATAIVSGFVDIAWLPPLPFIRLERRGAVVPLVAHEREGRTSFHSVIIVLRGSRFTDVSELAGARPAWVDTDSASGYVLPRLHLAEAGLDPRTAFGEARFSGSHEALVRALVAGKADFGATYAGLDDQGNTTRGPWRDVTDEKGRPAEIRVLAKAGVIPGDTTAARVGLSAALQDRIREALQALPGERESRTLVRRLFGVDAFRPWESADDAGGVVKRYDDLRRLTEDALRRGVIEEAET
jgi:phosphonate transport system substrate-binding protein